MQVSHSRVETFENCKYKYKLQYVNKLKTLQNDDPSNPLFLGTALHTGIEKDAETAIKEYYQNYPIITDLHINEAIKLKSIIKKAKEMLPENGIHELKIENEHFIGFIDLLVPIDNSENEFDLYDFKYSNNIDHYLKSRQLHEYKYFFELTNPDKKIRDLYFLFVPKIQIRQKKSEDLYQFRTRLENELDLKEPKLVKIDYDPNKVIDFAMKTKELLEEDEFPKNPDKLCDFCNFKKFCLEGVDYMILPSCERRTIQEITKKTAWIYGAPFVGKTTFVNDFPNPLMLNTDGNIKFLDAPYISIKNSVTVDGRIQNKTNAWDTFKDVIEELEKNQNDYKTIIVDLLEDTYELCRLRMYDEMGIKHESDAPYKSWDIVRTEYLSTIKRLVNLDYENIILISHEDTSKDITKSNQDKITAIRPNIQEKIANKLAGMVDIVGRAIIDKNGERKLSFESDELIFGGGRISTLSNEIPLSYGDFVNIYKNANKKIKEGKEKEQVKSNGRKNSRKMG